MFIAGHHTGEWATHYPMAELANLFQTSVFILFYFIFNFIYLFFHIYLFILLVGG